jgi:xenotropic and polytropic retrovirus receptor 1
LLVVELVRRTIWSFFRLENEHLHRTSLGFRRQNEFIPFHFETDVGLDNKPELKSRWRQIFESSAVLVVVVAFSVAAIVAGGNKASQQATTTPAPSPVPA